MPASKTPVQKQPQCPTMTLAPQAAPAVTPLTAELVAPLHVADLIAAVLVPDPVTRVSFEDEIQHPPPDLYLLNATLLV